MRPYLVLHMEAEGLLSLAGVDGCLFSSSFRASFSPLFETVSLTRSSSLLPPFFG